MSLSASTAILYIRCSTVGQVTDGVSLDVQKARAASWANANGYVVEATYADEGISGRRSTNRPGLTSALDHVCLVRGALVVYSLSRLARSTKDALLIAERLDKAGADLVSLSERLDTTTAAGKLMFRMLAVLAEFERDLVSERTTAALALKKARGERVGQVPFGYAVADNGTSLVQDVREIEVLEEMRALRSLGLPWREIAERLNRAGRTNKSGGCWTLHHVRKVALAA